MKKETIPDQDLLNAMRVKDIKLIKYINIEDEPDIAEFLHLGSYPSYIIIRGNKHGPVGVGYRTPEQLIEWMGK